MYTRDLPGTITMPTVKSVSWILRKIASTLPDSPFQSHQYVEHGYVERHFVQFRIINVHKRQSCFTHVCAVFDYVGCCPSAVAWNCSHAGNSLLEIPGALLEGQLRLPVHENVGWTIVMDPSPVHAIIIMGAERDDITWFGPPYCGTPTVPTTTMTTMTTTTTATMNVLPL